MRKTCSKCNTDNPIESQFCKSCGTRLESETKPLGHNSVSSITSQYVSTKDTPNQNRHMDDLLFVPKKKSNTLKWLLLILFLLGGGFMFLVFLAWLGSEDTTYYDTDTSTTTNYDYDSDFPLSYLELTKIDSEWVGNTFYIKGTLKNGYSTLAKNVKIRVDFKPSENSTDIFDTRYFTVVGVPATGAYSFREPLYINEPGGQFWYQAQIQSAEK
jgi:hypothetical protein